MVFGIVLNRNGWRIDYLGMSTPVEELTRTVDTRHPDLVGLAATLTGNLEPLATQLTALARRAPRDLRGARLLTGEPVTAIWRRERLAPSMNPASARNARSGASSNEPPTSIPATSVT